MNKPQTTEEIPAVRRIREQLFSFSDPSYKAFHGKLMPTVPKDRLIGVRTPIIRALAKNLRGSQDALLFMAELPHRYYEEDNLHACLIEGITDYEACIKELMRFLPWIDNWATCDMLSPKIFKKHLTQLEKECFLWLESSDTYTVRFGIKMLMTYFLEEHFLEEYPDRVASIRSREYYINMMIAWYFATALAKQYDASIRYIEEHKLDEWTHNKATQKAMESYRVTDEQKSYLRTLKIK